MNQVIIIGRLTKSPEVKTTQSGVAVCAFTVAVDRKFKDAQGNRQADFLSCVAWRQSAELLGRYFQKGSRIGIVGNLQSRSYDDQNGKKVYVTEILVDQIEFIDKAGEHQAAPAPSEQYPTMDDDTTLPFDL